MEPIKLKFKEATLKRCKILTLEEKELARFVPISLELFQFIHEAKAIDFNLYFRIGNTIVEFIKPEEFGRELLNEMWEAMQKARDGMEVCLQRKDRPKFDLLINKIRDRKIDSVRKAIPQADKKTLDLYANLSTASQMIVSGGIDSNVVAHVKASAAFMVSNVIDSDAAISTLSRMIICDPTLYDHSATVAMIATVIGQNNLPHPLKQKEAEQLSQSALYHDVGKTCVPNEILNKPGKFTPEEFEIMKSHTTLGHAEVVRMIESGANIDAIVARVALEHHEKWDGTGYPNKRRGAAEVDPENGIHLFSRIVTIADVYSALLMKRVYKPAFEPQDAIKIMAAESKGFDPSLFLPFLKGVVKSLNFEQTKIKAGRILIMDEKGDLNEWKDGKKVAS